MSEVTITEILFSREKRVQKQRELLLKHRSPLICFTMNIAGPIKVSTLIRRAFYEGITLLEELLPEGKFLEKEITEEKTGFEAFFSLDMNEKEIKNICVEIEESTSLGRLFDMDVLDINGKKLERENERGCFICGKKGRSCSAGRVHSVEELQRVTREIMHGYFEEKDRKVISALATQSLIDEARTTPKPGLVDGRNSGSHNDMNIITFIKSADALAPYFYECVKIGQSTKELSPDEVFSKLRKEGIKAEKTMLDATGGANTHKGAIYSLGTICGAVGRLWESENATPDTEKILSECQLLVKESTKKDFENIDSSTAGGRFYLEHGFLGIRGEVLEGFPSVSGISLPVYEKALADGLSHNDAGVISLLHLIANVNDTNLYKRGGMEGIEYAKNRVRALLSKVEYPSRSDIEALDDEFIKKNLSPGGCADLLAVTYFLSKMKSGVV